MDTKNLITIGTLAKITGVHIKSLYYYEQIGILLPIYTDPQTSYRYYSHEQILFVGWIQHFIDLGLPLKELQNFISDDRRTIYSDALLAYEIEMTEKKIKMLQNKQQLLSKMKEEITFSENILSFDKIVTCNFEKKFMKVTPLKPPFSLISVQKEIMNSFFKMRELDLTPGGEMGMLCFYRNGARETYAFLEILDNNDIPTRQDIQILPAGTYQCIKTDVSSIDSAKDYFPALFAQDYEKIVIETIPLTLYSDYSHRVFQLRCSLPV